MTDLTYGQVTGRILALIGDGIDAGTVPDTTAVTGTVTFTPLLDGPLRASVDPAGAIVTPRPVVCTIDGDGDLSLNGSKDVYLLATDSPAISPAGLVYRVTFAIKVGDVAVELAGFSINVPAGTTVNLATVYPTTASLAPFDQPLTMLVNQVSVAPGAPGFAPGVPGLWFEPIGTGKFRMWIEDAQ